ncbi:uncharacterized protein H6S33_005828 [Morchella sextelata]|uniref:uncharacterized protein n=1 Tax=Morchella sextelata TaxID=1174677 RepID=UPI001D0593B9|nr:uncharacterized protein H6S33_005828 [Morchella sextelata]KAH0613942.1 hypothetical protein H6S33_005828 [Morchella sextelata]
MEDIDGKENTEAGKIVSVWMTRDHGSEEMSEENGIRKLVEKIGKGMIEFRVFEDESYLIDRDDLPMKPNEVSDVFTQFRKTVEPLRDNVRDPHPRPISIAPIPHYIPAQKPPFTIPDSLDGLISSLLKPLQNLDLPGSSLQTPPGAKTAHPFKGGETSGLKRIDHMLATGAMTTYKDTRNGLLGEDFSCKFAAWLAQGCVSSRIINKAMFEFEEGRPWKPILSLPNDKSENKPHPQGYGKGENKGTASIRFELLWRDYFRLCMLKFGPKIFSQAGYRGDTSYYWKTLSDPAAKEDFGRWQRGNTGMGLVDASMRELYLTGWTSNRARQNVASYLAKRMKMDWRLGAEWYECMLVDYDTSSNWGNWQYTAGVGNDPRGESRVFNQVKQAHDYDPSGDYIKYWVHEDKVVDFSEDGKISVQNPLIRIDYAGANGGRGGKVGRGSKGGHGRGGGGGGGSGGKKNRGEVRGDRLGDGGDEGIEPGREG